MRVSFIEYFLDTCTKYPNNVAVSDSNKEITFDSLRKRVLSFSEYLTKINPKLGIVAVLLPKSIEAVAADLAVTASGGAFTNIDINLPEKRLFATLENIHPDIIITLSRMTEKLEDFGKTIDIEELIAADTVANYCAPIIIDTDPFCIINTSGSTGVPKAVVLNHRSFVDFCQWSMETFEFSEKTIMGSLSPTVFDIFVFELCMMCIVGAKIVLLDSKLAILPGKLLRQIKDSNVDFIFWVPTIMVNIANSNLLSKELPDKLKLIWFAGEVFPTKQFNYWKKFIPEAIFVNMYGPIEITLDCTYYMVDREFSDDEPLPIGKPCRNTDILILNSKDEECKPGEDGELCVRGSSLAMGYYNNPEKTAEVFVQNPLNGKYPETIYRTGDIVSKDENGLIYIKGRKDHIIKHLGYRIDLSEIEHVLVNTLKIVDNCCVIYNKVNKNMFLFYEGRMIVDINAAKREVTRVLPKYMIPQNWIYVESLPMNTNGKIDRNLLEKSLEV